MHTRPDTFLRNHKSLDANKMSDYTACSSRFSRRMSGAGGASRDEKTDDGSDDSAYWMNNTTDSDDDASPHVIGVNILRDST